MMGGGPRCSELPPGRRWCACSDAQRALAVRDILSGRDSHNAAGLATGVQTPLLPNKPAMSGFSGWLAGLVSGLWAPTPGTHESFLEEWRLGALLEKEFMKPPGQRDEELIHRLRVHHARTQLGNAKVGPGQQLHSRRRGGAVWSDGAMGGGEQRGASSLVASVKRASQHHNVSVYDFTC